MEYLTETRLGDILKIIYPNNTFIHDKVIPNCYRKFRPDYRCDELKMVVEYDGHHHYTSPKTIVRDIEKMSILSDMGYKIIKIPYFVQLTDEIIKKLFGVSIVIGEKYPHGFISDNVILPAEFCSLGVCKFLKDLEIFEEIKSDILQSLHTKNMNLKNLMLVYPYPIDVTSIFL